MAQMLFDLLKYPEPVYSMLSRVYTTPLRTISSLSNSPRQALGKSVLFWLAYLAAGYACFYIAQFLFAQFGRHNYKEWHNYGYGTLTTIASYFITKWFLAREGRTLSSIGMVFESHTVTRFLAGFAIGTLILVVMVSCLISFGQLRVHSIGEVNWASVLFWNTAFIPMALNEEIGFRAYSLQRLQTGYGQWPSQLITALAFAGIHIIGGSGWIGALVGTGTWSIVYGLSAVWSRGIALPTGMHAACNICQALVGMKSGISAIWTLEPASSAPGSGTDISLLNGLVTQLLVMSICVSVLAWLVRKSRVREYANDFN
jgi:membrane protease YdiL (CAAX protease family)